MDKTLSCLNDSPAFQWLKLEEVDSTNNYLNLHAAELTRPLTLVTAEYQTAGRGQRGNSWESEHGKNLVFSMLVHPKLPVSHIFTLSEASALAIRDALSAYTDGVEIKWPNDIYWQNRKLAGILIETKLSGKTIADGIIGVGININQQNFLSNAPNPISLFGILGKETDRFKVLDNIVENITANFQLLEQGRYDELHARFMSVLYRRTGFHPYRDEQGHFLAEVMGVEPSGHLILHDTEGKERRYAFKEVEFIILKQ